MLHSGLHGPGGHQDLGHEDDVVAELDSHHRHAGDQPVVQNDVGIKVPVQSFPGQAVGLVVLADDDVKGDILHQGVGIFQDSPNSTALFGDGDPLQFFLQAIVDNRH